MVLTKKTGSSSGIKKKARTSSFQSPLLFSSASKRLKSAVSLSRAEATVSYTCRDTLHFSSDTCIKSLCMAARRASAFKSSVALRKSTLPSRGNPSRRARKSTMYCFWAVSHMLRLAIHSLSSMNNKSMLRRTSNGSTLDFSNMSSAINGGGAVMVVKEGGVYYCWVRAPQRRSLNFRLEGPPPGGGRYCRHTHTLLTHRK